MILLKKIRSVLNDGEFSAVEYVDAGSCYN